MRVQGAFVSDKEVSDVVDYLKENQHGQLSIMQAVSREAYEQSTQSTECTDEYSNGDEGMIILQKPARFIIEKKKARSACCSVYYKIGFNRAAQNYGSACRCTVLSDAEEGTKPRKVLMTPEAV